MKKVIDSDLSSVVFYGLSPRETGREKALEA